MMLLKIKRLVGSIICSKIISEILRRWFSNGIPHRGSLIHTENIPWRNTSAYLFWGLYESAEIRFIDQYIQPDTDVIELGGNIGGVASHTIKKLNLNQRYFCVEANPLLTGLLKQNIEKNSCGQRSQVINAAISSSGHKQFFSINEQSLASKLSTDGDIEVPVKTLSQVIAENAITQYVLISDIEGAEAELFSEDFVALKNCSLVIIELHDCRYNNDLFTIEDLIILIERNTNLNLVDRYHDVCVFKNNL